MISNKKGFTLVELLVVVGMITLIMGAMTVSVSAANERARVQKATAEVKVISQAILAYENYRHELPILTEKDADKSSIGFLLGDGGSAQSGGQIPVLLMAALRDGNRMYDPWGTPYRITIKPKVFQVKPGAASGSLRTGYFMPNWYRLTEDER